MSGVGSAITTAFSSAASEVQGIWSAVPGFFSGIFGSLGGVASAAGSAIAAGLTSAIGTVIGAWQSAAATISGIISSIAAAASSAVASAGAIVGIGHNATGTSSWKGGFTEINEHGGEILNLPRGTQIIPHATTVNILKREIRNSIQNGETNYHGLNFMDFGMPEPPREVEIGKRWNKKPSTPFTSRTLGTKFEIFGRIADIFSGKQNRETDSLIYKMPEIKKDADIGRRWNMKKPDILGGIISGSFEGLGNIFGGGLDIPNIMNMNSVPQIDFPSSSSSSSSSTTNNSNSSNTFNFGGVQIHNGADFDDFVYRLSSMLGNSSINYGG